MDFRRNPRVFRAWRVERLKNRVFGKDNSRAQARGRNSRHGIPEHTRKGRD